MGPNNAPDDKQLRVRLYGQPVGVLEQSASGHLRFTYDLDCAPPQLSLGLPVRPEPYDHPPTEAYFGGLLPESAAARKAIGRRYGVNPNNSFSLLKAIGYDCAGAVSLHPLDDDRPPDAPQHPLLGRVLSEADLYQHLVELPEKPLFLGLDGLRLSLAGAQDKAAVCLINHQVALPKGGCPTTHILKPVAQGLDGMVHNEYLCLRVAHLVGLTVPAVEIRWVRDQPYLLIERYDRRLTGNHVQRLHQEDFCQALGIVSAYKYQADGGPSLTQCFTLLRQTTQPVRDRNALARQVVFNYLIGNQDAHGKNFSLLYPTPQTVALAPAYDLVCTRVYDALAQKMAMKIGGYYPPEAVLPRHWARQCQEMGYAYPALRKLLHTQGLAILEAVRQERTRMESVGLGHPVLAKIEQFLNTHITRTLNHFETDEP